MKFFILCLATAVCGASAAQANEATKYSADVGVQAIARAVIEKKLVKKDDRAIIALALETGKVELGEMTCERGLGSDYCSFQVFVKDDETTEEAEETTYQLDVRLREGRVVSAALTGIAG